MFTKRINFNTLRKQLRRIGMTFPVTKSITFYSVKYFTSFFLYKMHTSYLNFAHGTALSNGSDNFKCKFDFIIYFGVNMNKSYILHGIWLHGIVGKKKIKPSHNLFLKCAF